MLSMCEVLCSTPRTTGRDGGNTTMTGYFRQARICDDKEEKAELKGKSIIYEGSRDSPQEKEAGN